MFDGLVRLRSADGDEGAVEPLSAGQRDHGTDGLFDPVVIPVATAADARRTGRVVGPHLEQSGGTVVLVHVVVRQKGWPDALPPSVSASRADRVFEVGREAFGAGDVSVETRLLEGEGVARAILRAARDLEAGSIAFLRRGGGRLVKLLTGDVERALVSRSTRPVLVFPADS